MRIVIMGTGGFAVPTLERLLGSRHDIEAVVTMPLRNSRGAKSVVTPVRRFATAVGLDVFDPEDINDPAFLPTLQSWQADLLFVCDYGKILAPHVLAATTFGGINLHGSLLPKYRGAAPINRALLNGEPTVGVSVIHITPQLDAGPVVAMSDPLPVLTDDTAVEIESRLARIGADLVMAVLPQIENGTLTPVMQRDELATKAPKLKKQDGEIIWQRSAQEIIWQYQAMQPWPKIFTTWHRQNAGETEPEPMRLILGRVREPADTNAKNETAFGNAVNVANGATGVGAVPGTVVAAENDTITVATGNGILQILEIQPAGRNLMPVNAFLRGYPMKPGDRLSDRGIIDL